jgi:hypothetical protein
MIWKWNQGQSDGQASVDAGVASLCQLASPACCKAYSAITVGTVCLILDELLRVRRAKS